MNLKKTIVFLLSCFILIAAGVYIHFLQGVSPVLLKKQFIFFPFEIDGWKDRDKPESDYLAGVLGADDILLREYENKDGDKMELYFSYFEYTREKKTPHAPQLCWVGSGWSLADMGDETISLDCEGCPPVVVKKIFAEKADRQILLYYCYSTGTEYVADLLRFKTLLAWNSLFRRKSNAFTMQLSMPVNYGNMDQKALAMEAFLTRAFTVLEQDFLP